MYIYIYIQLYIHINLYCKLAYLNNNKCFRNDLNKSKTSVVLPFSAYPNNNLCPITFVMPNALHCLH